MLITFYSIIVFAAFYLSVCGFKGTVHPKIKMDHLLTLKLFQTSEFLSSVEHKRRYFEEFWLPTFFCVQQKKETHTTVNDDRI